MALRPGDRVGGGYRIVRLLGRGGMGHVYETVVVWSPKLSEAEAAKRVYTTYGKKTLEGSHGGDPCTIGPWTPVEMPAQGGWWFFKVGVEMR